MKSTTAARSAIAALAVAALAGMPLASAAPSASPVSAGPAAAGPAAGGSPAGAAAPALGPRRSPRPEATSATAFQFGETLAELKVRRMEVAFLGAIVPHHRAAIKMARMELRRGVSRDVRAHADNIIDGQRDQVADFIRWLKKWYGLTPQQAMAQASPEARREMARMDKEAAREMVELERVPAGPRFDVAFVRRMIPHHSAGIIEFLTPQSRAVHPQLRVAASSGIMTQEAQIADFRTWLAGRR